MTERRPSIINPRRPTTKRPLNLVNYGSLLLENTGTVARDHLASERTFLAWLRTSVSFASVGIALTQLLKIGDGDTQEDHLVKLGRAMGISFVGLAAITLLIGAVRYFAVQELLTDDNEFPASIVGVLFVVISVTILSIATFVIVLKV